MKFLLLFISLSAMAGWISEDNLLKCHSGSPYTVYKDKRANMYDLK